MKGRNLPNSSAMQHIIKFYSAKNQRALYCESYTEKLACIEREFDPQIIKYFTQPVSVFYSFEGKRCRYTPDALLVLGSGETVFEEVKPEELVENSIYLQKLNAAAIQTGTPIRMRRIKTSVKYRSTLELIYARVMREIIGSTFINHTIH